MWRIDTTFCLIFSSAALHLDLRRKLTVDMAILTIVQRDVALLILVFMLSLFLTQPLLMLMNLMVLLTFFHLEAGDIFAGTFSLNG